MTLWWMKSANKKEENTATLLTAIYVCSRILHAIELYGVLHVYHLSLVTSSFFIKESYLSRLHVSCFDALNLNYFYFHL
jgi:hypothetical protein